MTTSTVQPGMRAATAPASPYTPIAVINGTPIYALRGGRSGGGIAIVAGDADGDDDDELLGDADDDDDDDDESDELPEVMRGKAKKAAPRKTTRSRADVEDDEDDADEDADEDDTPGAIRRMEDALKRANSTAAKYRRAGKLMTKLGIEDLPTYLTSVGIDPETGRPFGSDVIDPDDEDDDEGDLFDEFEPRDDRRSRDDEKKRDRDTVRAIRTAEKRAEAKVRAELVPILAQTAATNALRAAGFKGSEARLERLLRMIDPEDLDINIDAGTFEIEGLDEQVAELQDEFPELFPAPVEARSTRTGGTRTRPARRASGAAEVDGGGRGRPAKKAGGWAEQVIARMDRGQ